MKYVLDSSVAVKWVLREKDSPKAIQLWTDFRAGIHELIAPDVLPVECGHALTRAERRGLMAIGQADTLFLDILSSAPHLHPHQPILRRAIAISSSTRQGVYD